MPNARRKAKRSSPFDPAAAKDAELLEEILAGAVWTPRPEPPGVQQLPSGVRRSIVAADGLRVAWAGLSGPLTIACTQVSIQGPADVKVAEDGTLTVETDAALLVRRTG